MSLVAGIMGGASLAGAGISAAGAESAAGTQANAAEQSQQLQAQEAQNALNFQEQQWNTQQQQLAPYLSAGTGALSNLQSILNSPGQGWNQTFTAPTAEEAAQYPGYQFQLGQGEQALQNSAASKGALYSGNTQEALANYAEQAGQSDYTNVYNQAFNQYLQNYSQYGNQLNRLSALAGTGQTAANTLGTEGQAAASNLGNISLTTGAQQGQDIQNAAAATASGYVGTANALNAGLTGSTSNLSQLLMLQQLLGNGAPGSNVSPTGNTSGYGAAYGA